MGEDLLAAIRRVSANSDGSDGAKGSSMQPETTDGVDSANALKQELEETFLTPPPYFSSEWLDRLQQ